MNSTNTSLRDPEFWLLRQIPLRLMIPLALIAATAAWIATALGAPTAAVIAIGAVVLIGGAVPVRRREPRNIVGILARAIAFRWRRTRPGPADTGQAAFDVPLPEGGSYGVRWDGDLLLTMLRIDPPPDALTLLRRGSLSTDQVLPLTEIGRCLSQFDINLASIDVISTGARTAGGGPVAQLYDRILGPLPAIAYRTVWLVLRLDPLANAEAVDNRGGGGAGALRTAIIATRRVANRLAARDISVSVLTATEMNSAVRQLTRGIALDGFVETPKSLVHAGIHLTSYEIGPELIGSRGFADIWATPSLATTVTVRLRRGTGRPGDEPASPPITLGALVRFDTTAEPVEPPVPGLRTLPGEQFRALLDCLPARTARRDGDSAGNYRGPLAALDDIAVPTAGCGQLIGADNAGQGIAVPLIGDGTRHLEVIGRLDLAQQVILRAIALGAHTVVHTDRPEAWQSMVANVDAPHSLSLAPRFAGAGHNVAPTPPRPGVPIPTATVVVFDGIAPTALTGGATIVHVRAPEQPEGRFDADIILVQDVSAPNLITVRTSTASATVNMVTTPDEMRYIGESLAAAR
ncbi:type VII secretion protein EccE [Nocardia sp. NBC_00565]|uniref:type VII secretion protein EccE n=1 Tax=Nocardia sp. NBC_00565 TaxID=2975993 RepID=UPI002E80ED74|nr:type VII secretion protein EccE [Nocardia sp. NBC_00565]WUC02881.1 type VII secretion protein EccE [Nocardia sp. NBC_00565]